MLKQKISVKEVFRLRKLLAQSSRNITLFKKQNKLLKETKESQDKIIDEKDRLIKQLTLQIEKLTLQVEELNKIVFKPKKKKLKSKKISKITKERTKASYKRRVPKDSEITKKINHPIDVCPDCHTKLTSKKIVIFYIEDINLPTEKTNHLKTVEKHFVEKGYCNKCRKYHSSIKIPTTKVVIGKNTRMYITYLAILLRSSYSQILKLFKDTYSFKLSEGEISNILNSEAQSLKPEFERLKKSIRKQAGIHMDETPYKVYTGKLGNYAWILTGTDNEDVVFDIGKSRGKGVAKKLQGDTKLIGISDDYNAYSKLFKIHQLCWAHPNRKLRDLADSDKLEDKTKKHCTKVYLEFNSLYNDLQEILDKDLPTKDMEKLEGDFKDRLIKLSQPHKKDPDKLKRIKKGLLRNQDKYFTCLHYKGIPIDNNKAERGLRHLVLKRKISFGARTQKGADRLSILMSVLLSLWNRNHDMFFQEYADLK